MEISVLTYSHGNIFCFTFKRVEIHTLTGITTERYIFPSLVVSDVCDWLQLVCSIDIKEVTSVMMNWRPSSDNI